MEFSKWLENTGSSRIRLLDMSHNHLKTSILRLEQLKTELVNMEPITYEQGQILASIRSDIKAAAALLEHIAD